MDQRQLTEEVLQMTKKWDGWQGWGWRHKKTNLTGSPRTEMRYLFPLLTLGKKEKWA